MLDMMFTLPSQTDVKEVRGHRDVVENKSNPLDASWRRRARHLALGRRPSHRPSSRLSSRSHRWQDAAMRSADGVVETCRWCRCGTSWCSRTPWCPSSWAASPRCWRSSRRSAERTSGCSWPPSATPRWTTRRPTRSTRSGTSATIVQHLKLPNGNVKLLVEGMRAAASLEIERGRRRLLPRRDLSASTSRGRDEVQELR